ncbi:hypothetical protein HZS_3672 [Henneguya salminicola]|nr:hypothetical protein HZS_3672 [Henneguya salminicola]
MKSVHSRLSNCTNTIEETRSSLIIKISTRNRTKSNNQKSELISDMIEYHIEEFQWIRKN